MSIILGVFAVLLICFVWLFTQGFFSFKAKVINCSKSQSIKMSVHDLNLIESEKSLRRNAYSNSTMSLDDSFFDDSDMSFDYHILTVYHKRTKQVLLSARYYKDAEKIKKTIIGNKSESSYLLAQRIVPELLKENVIFIDRMSANTRSAIFRKHRDMIHLLFYVKIYEVNKNKSICAMARSSKRETLLFKYADWGLSVIGKTSHNGVEHWIMTGNFKRSFQKVKNSFWYNSMFILKLIAK